MANKQGCSTYVEFTKGNVSELCSKFCLWSVFKRWHLIRYICQKTNHFSKNLLIKRFFWYIWHFDTIAGYHLTELWNIFNISTKKWRSPSGTATAHTKFSGLEVFWLLWIKWSGWKCGMFSHFNFRSFCFL